MNVVLEWDGERVSLFLNGLQVGEDISFRGKFTGKQ